MKNETLIFYLQVGYQRSNYLPQIILNQDWLHDKGFEVNQWLEVTVTQNRIELKPIDKERIL